MKSLEARDLIVPVVGNLGGPPVAGWRSATTSRRAASTSRPFYISNVETYLFGETATQFARNVARLPFYTHSVIIRSIFRASVSAQSLEPMSQFVAENR